MERTAYEVPGWGTGTLWTHGPVVLAHDFDYEDSDEPSVDLDAGLAGEKVRAAEGPAVRGASGDALRAASPWGVDGPLGITLPDEASRMGHASVPVVRRARRLPSGPGGGFGANADVVARLTGFFIGEDLRDITIDLSWCTPFQRNVVETLRAVPRGEVVSYGELAVLAGAPGAQRAVGTICARNRFALLVPCHRVVSAHGIGGYGTTGVAVKRRLLALEGVHL